ncbi:exported hypothetical protein [Frigoribacterium sp. 9N]|nr:exported hypothetical protein [Frigoribacterium sp. 9N]
MSCPAAPALPAPRACPTARICPTAPTCPTARAAARSSPASPAAGWVADGCAGDTGAPVTGAPVTRASSGHGTAPPGLAVSFVVPRQIGRRVSGERPGNVYPRRDSDRLYPIRAAVKRRSPSYPVDVETLDVRSE